MKFQPSIYRGVHLRGYTKYMNLNDHSFTALEKLWICEEIRGFHFNDNKPPTFATICQRHGIPNYRLRKWLQLFRTNKLIKLADLSDCLFDDTSLIVIQTYLSNPTQENDEVVLHDLLLTEMNNSRIRLV